MNILYPIISVIIVSLLSLLAAIPFIIKKKIPNKFLLFLLSVSVGVILATVFLDFLPEIFEHGFTQKTSYIIMGGFLIMFILEKFVHWHHGHNHKHDPMGHSHAYNVAPLNIIGDAIHNFLDGLVIAGAYAVNTAVGISTTIAIVFHEIPTEIADFGVLLYSGMNKKKAIFFNLLSAVTAIIGAVVGIILINIQGFEQFIIPFAAGTFLYIGASNLVPQLHRHCGIKDSLLHIFAIIVGIGIISLVSIFGLH